MNEKIVLQLDFTDSFGKPFRLTVENPLDDLVQSEIEDAMGNIIAENIFISNGVDLVMASGARIVKTTVHAWEL